MSTDTMSNNGHGPGGVLLTFRVVVVFLFNVGRSAMYDSQMLLQTHAYLLSAKACVLSNLSSTRICLQTY